MGGGDQEIKASEITSGQFSDALTILSQLPKLRFVITLTNTWEETFKLFQLCSTADDFSDVKTYFRISECNIDLVTFLSKGGNFSALSESLAQTFIKAFKTTLVCPTISNKMY